jgi:quinol monooxygenase YgiN
MKNRSNYPFRLLLPTNKGSCCCCSQRPLLNFLASIVAGTLLVLFSRVFPVLSFDLLRRTVVGASSSTMMTEGKPFSLFVTLQFHDLSTKNEFLDDIRPLMDHIRVHEPTCIGYEVLLSDQDELQVLILERYQDKEIAFLQIHRSSAEFLTFRPKLQAMQSAGRVTMAGQSYYDSNLGFVGRV